ncbi:MAG TPA: GNAT family N-acetyltransferase [Rhabdochlamydiaceae bacterium]|nr:GNAT family N-acetyltransferase [Rhabdochlamydiaceae bacterium]
MKKSIAFIVICFFSVSLCAAEIFFEDASPEEFELLEQLAMDSSAFCGYCAVLEEGMKNPFCICKDHFDGTVRVMKNQSGIMGFYALHRNIDAEDGTWVNLLSHLFLKPEYIGHGYGRALFEEAMRAARDELHWEALFWESFPKAVGFYKKMGAQQVGETPCSINPEYKSQILVYLLY